MPDISSGKFVVVGGASLLGSHIAEQLLAKGAAEVVILDNLSLGAVDAIDALLTDKRCTFLRADILRINELFDPFDKADGIFAVAGFLARPMTANPWMGIDVNVRGLQNVLEVARIKGVGKVIFSSSVGIYGAIGDEPNTDDAPLRWSGMQPGVALYCTSKIMGENLGFLFQRQYGLDFLALRYSAIYGERQHKRALDGTRIVEAYEKLRAGQPPVIVGTGEQVQDYLYVGDAARANLMAMESAATGEGMNIVSGDDTSQNRIVALIAEAMGSDIQPIHHTDAALPSMPVEAKQGYSREKAKRLLNWEPEVSLEEGTRRLVTWFERESA